MANWNVLYVTNEIWHDAPEMFTSSYFKILKKKITFLQQSYCYWHRKIWKMKNIKYIRKQQKYPSKKAWDLVGIVDVTRSQSGQKGLLHQGPALSLLLLVIWPRCWETVRQDVEATGNREALRFMMHKHITGFHFLNQWQKNTARFT